MYSEETNVKFFCSICFFFSVLEIICYVCTHLTFVLSNLNNYYNSIFTLD